MNTHNITIALVLKTGGETYDHRYVNNIVDGLKANITIPHKIVCLTDDPRGLSYDIDRIVKFKHDWPKWWGKIELFRPGVFGDEQIFFFDLDTFIVGDLNNILSYDGIFCALQDFYQPHHMGSGIMSWHGESVHKIYESFRVHATKYMNNTPGGDQVFINQHVPRIDYFQLRFPREIISYKVHCVKGTGHSMVPDDARVICFHGKPRPHEITTQLQQFWKQ